MLADLENPMISGGMPLTYPQSQGPVARRSDSSDEEINEENRAEQPAPQMSVQERIANGEVPLDVLER